MLYVQCSFYVLIVDVVLNIVEVNGLSDKSASEIVMDTVLPIRIYWFMAVYFLLCMLAPYMNKLLEILDKKKQIQLVIVLTFINTVYGFMFKLVGFGSSY